VSVLGDELVITASSLGAMLGDDAVISVRARSDLNSNVVVSSLQGIVRRGWFWIRSCAIVAMRPPNARLADTRREPLAQAGRNAVTTPPPDIL
jgi:hypothetical protein